MELTKRMIEGHLKSSKKIKSEMTYPQWISRAAGLMSLKLYHILDSFERGHRCMEAFDMELTKRMIEGHLKSSKKIKSEMTYPQWISRAAGLRKNQMSVRNMDRIAHAKIPFNVVRYHPDNDKTILKILFEGLRGDGRVSLTRSRPYEKNDNAHVEQKGGDKVRKLVEMVRAVSATEI
ncbi:MAG: hypothetical protein GX468_09025 [Thermotogaceae bacterium]|nr:hypothetical protein [Thermotogaceae bacterium]